MNIAGEVIARAFIAKANAVLQFHVEFSASTYIHCFILSLQATARLPAYKDLSCLIQLS